MNTPTCTNTNAFNPYKVKALGSSRRKILLFVERATIDKTKKNKMKRQITEWFTERFSLPHMTSAIPKPDPFVRLCISYRHAYVKTQISVYNSQPKRKRKQNHTHFSSSFNLACPVTNPVIRTRVKEG